MVEEEQHIAVEEEELIWHVGAKIVSPSESTEGSANREDDITSELVTMSVALEVSLDPVGTLFAVATTSSKRGDEREAVSTINGVGSRREKRTKFFNNIFIDILDCVLVHDRRSATSAFSCLLLFDNGVEEGTDVHGASTDLEMIPLT